MVVTSGIERAIQYYHAFKTYLVERKSPYQAIVAFSGEHDLGRSQGQRGVPQRVRQQRDRRQDPDRSLPLPDLRRQVPDRLRRAAAAHDVCGQAAVGHQGRADAVPPQPRPSEEARLLRARFPEQQRDDHLRFPGLLPDHDAGRGDRPQQTPRPEADLDGAGVFAGADQQVVELFLGGAAATKLGPHSRRLRGRLCNNSTKTDRWISRARPRRSPAPTLPGSILPYGNAGWEKLSILLNLLIPKLPAPKEEDLQRHPRIHRHGQLPRREEARPKDRLLADDDAEIEPVPSKAAAASASPNSTA
jgi:type I restriction enzyme, R subunit